MKNDYLNTLEEGDMLIREDFDFEFDNQRMLFPIEVWFDADKKFGVNTNDTDGAWVNMYATYNPCTNELKILYTVDADEGTYEREYIPTDEERSLFIRLMEQSCEKRMGLTCREAYIREYIDQADEISLVCELYQDGCRIRNENDDFILYAENKEDCIKNLIKYVDKSIVLANYNRGQTYSIECEDSNTVIYSTDMEELQFSEEQNGITMQ